jgi:hypothetical protein
LSSVGREVGRGGDHRRRPGRGVADLVNAGKLADAHSAGRASARPQHHRRALEALADLVDIADLVDTGELADRCSSSSSTSGVDRSRLHDYAEHVRAPACSTSAPRCSAVVFSAARRSYASTPGRLDLRDDKLNNNIASLTKTLPALP